MEGQVCLEHPDFQFCNFEDLWSRLIQIQPVKTSKPSMSAFRRDLEISWHRVAPGNVEKSSRTAPWSKWRGLFQRNVEPKQGFHFGGNTNWHFWTSNILSYYGASYQRSDSRSPARFLRKYWYLLNPSFFCYFLSGDVNQQKGWFNQY